MFDTNTGLIHEVRDRREPYSDRTLCGHDTVDLAIDGGKNFKVVVGRRVTCLGCIAEGE